MLVLLHVVLEVLLADLRHFAQRHLAQRDQVAFAEERVERALGPLGRIDVAVPHALAQRVRRHVDQLDFVGVVDDAVGHALAHLDAGDVLDDVRQTLQVLDVDGADDGDARRRAGPRRPASACRVWSRARWCAPARRPAPPPGDARSRRRCPSPRRSRPCTRSACAARASSELASSVVFGRPCVSRKPMTASVPRSLRRMQLLERGVGFADARRDAEIDPMTTARAGACLAPDAIEHLVGARSAIGSSHARTSNLGCWRGTREANGAPAHAVGGSRLPARGCRRSHARAAGARQDRRAQYPRRQWST